MGDAKNFQYKNNAVSSPDFGTMLGDFFLGTNNAQNQANTQMLNYQNQFTDYMFNKANAFNEKMSNTAYQRAKNDMIDAGINPMVAFANGANAASSPSSAQAHSASSSAAGAKYANGIIGASTAKIIDRGLERLLRDSIDSDKKFLDSAKVASKFI